MQKNLTWALRQKQSLFFWPNVFLPSLGGTEAGGVLTADDGSVDEGDEFNESELLHDDDDGTVVDTDDRYAQLQPSC